MSYKEVDEQSSWGSLVMKEPSVHHLNIFGSLFYKHILDAKRSKIKDKRKTMILVGYHNTWYYRLFNPDANKLTTSRNMIILEDEVCNWNAKDNDVSQISCMFTMKNMM